MDSLVKFTPDSLKNNDAFVEHILSIIDTKLQFVEYRTSKIIKSVIKEPNPLAESLFDVEEEFNIEEIENEELFNQIEEYSRTTCLLLLLRINLFGKNASLVFELLSDDKFLDYNDIDLEKKLIESY
jgi:hypothetical protein